MKKIVLTLLLFSSIFAQANRILTLPPTAQVSSVGNVGLPFMSPARNPMMKDNFGFSRVNWMQNITDDMFYTHLSIKRQQFRFSMLAFNYGEQLETNNNGVVIDEFTPSSSVWSMSWGGKAPGTALGLSLIHI